MNNNRFALITGASDGLGKFLAFEIARRRMNLVLVALPETGLPGVADFIERHYCVTVEYFELDLSDTSSCYKLEGEIKCRQLEIQILINNAGVGGSHLFADRSPEFYEKQIRLNVLTTTLITRLFISRLAQCTPAYILNVGSLASFFTMPNKQVYSGTKAFIYHFSRSLRCETQGTGVSVSVICPGGINTNVNVTLLNKSCNWITRLSILTPERVASIAVEGLLKGKEVIIPGVMNNMFLQIRKVVPDYLKNILIKRNMRNHQNPGGVKRNEKWSLNFSPM